MAVAKASRDLSTIKLDKRYWFIAYDLPAESRRALSSEQRRFLNTMRCTLLNELYHRFDAMPVMQSLWILREPDRLVVSPFTGKEVPALDALEEFLDQWRYRYLKNGFPDVQIQCWPAAFDTVGDEYVKSRLLCMLFETLGSVEERVDQYVEKKNRVRPKMVEDMRGAISWARSIFVSELGINHKRWHEFERCYIRILDKIEQKLVPLLVRG